MRAIMLLATVALAGTAGAGEVNVTKDAQGRPIYTDTPQTVPAQKLDVRTSSTDPAQVQTRYSEEMKKYAADDASASKSASAQADASKAQALSAEDKAKRCADARNRYQAVMASYRLYVTGPDGERRYLDSAEIDAARIDAKKVMDEFCGGP
jgi:hypothetical protein